MTSGFSDTLAVLFTVVLTLGYVCIWMLWMFTQMFSGTLLLDTEDLSFIDQSRVQLTHLGGTLHDALVPPRVRVGRAERAVIPGNQAQVLSRDGVVCSESLLSPLSEVPDRDGRPCQVPGL